MHILGAPVLQYTRCRSLVPHVLQAIASRPGAGLRGPFLLYDSATGLSPPVNCYWSNYYKVHEREPPEFDACPPGCPVAGSMVDSAGLFSAHHLAQSVLGNGAVPAGGIPQYVLTHAGA